GQPVIYQAYPSAGAATGLTHGTTYFAINVNATTIKLAATYSDALGGTPVVDITATGSASSHGIISSVIQGLTASTVFYTIVVDANTIKLATSNANAIAGTAIDLLTVGGGNHVVYFTPTYSGAGTFGGAATMTISEPQSHIKGYFTLTNANPTITLGAGTYSMQPTINITKTMTLNGSGIGTTILDGGGKISSATSYFGINLSGIAAGIVTISNLKITGYYNGIDRNSAVANVTTNIDFVESSDNFSRGVNFEGAGAITTALNIRNGIYSDNNGVGVNSHGINISGMSKTGINIRNNTMSGNRTSAVEIGTGAQVSLIVRGNTISGTTIVTSLTNGVTEMGIGVIQTAALTGSNSNISQNTINMYGRAGIECRGCIGNGGVSGATSFRITSNYINQAGGPFTSDAGTTNTNETRDLAGIAVGNILAAGTPSGMVIDTNQIENLQQPNSASTVYTAFGIVSSGTSILNRLNIVTGCEVGIQVQQGAPGNEATSGDNYYGRDATATTTGFLANRNDITGNTVSGVRNQGTGVIQNFEGNWWGDATGPNVASNTSPSGAGETYSSTGTIAYNAWLAEDPDDVSGTGLGQVGIQWNGPKHFRVKLSANASSLSTPNVLNQAVAVVSNGIYTDTVDVHTGTYALSAESVVMSRRVYFRGNFGLATKPVINGTGSSFPTGAPGGDNVANNQILLQVTSRFCGIENFQINVNVPFFGAGARIGIGTANNGSFSRLRVKNNIIENYGSTAFSSWGMYLGSNSGVAGSDTVYIENNRISNRQGVNTSSFGRAIRTWYCNVQASGNTFLGVYSIQQATPRGAIGNNVSNNIMVGCHEINAPTAGTSFNISNNYYRVDSLSGGNHSANIEIRDNRSGTVPILIQNNTFQGIGDAQCPYGIFSTMADGVTIAGNTFSPKSSASTFVLILSTSKHQAASPLTAFSNGIDIYGNTFNGNSQPSSAKFGVIFANHNNTGDFNGGITMGTVGQPNTFKSNLSSWIYLDPLSGASTGAPSPYIWAIVGTSTTMVPTNVNIDATNNYFEVSGGTKLPTAMTLAELFDVEDMVTHAIDYGSLGFVTIKSSNAYVTTSSFVSPETAPSIGRAVTVSSDGWTISAKSNTYAETVTVNKSLTLQNDGTTIINNLTMNGTGKTLTLASDFEVSTSGVLTLTDGLINTGSNFLRVTNTASGAISGGSYLSHVLGNLNRAITTGVQYDYNVGDGTDQQLLTLTFTTISSLTDVNVRYTTTAPGTSMTTFNESGALYDDVLQTGYWIVDPNVGGTATNYSMRLKPINFTDYPTGAGIYSYTILKRVGAGTWGMNGVFDDPGTPERI
ncbi:MAG TPA: hypothetical protein PK509_13915, partial [Catalimonadaceae bacterium]|nr:hypothetical protein [Catalimonadaceae bacterium]